MMSNASADRAISFKEFLASQEDRLRAEALAQAEDRRQWGESVTSLINRLEGWIKEADPHNLVRLNRGLLGEADENGFLRTDKTPLETLDIQLGERAVHVRPNIAEVLGPRWMPAEGRWLGRVDMEAAGEPDRYHLFWFMSSVGGEVWFIRDSTTYLMTPLSQQTFDGVLVDLFS